MKKLPYIFIIVFFGVNFDIFPQHQPYDPSYSEARAAQQAVYYQPMTIQIASYLYQETALELTRKLISMGFPAYMERIAIGYWYYWRVVLYSVPANEVLTRIWQLENAGYRDLWVRPPTPHPSLWR